MKQCANPDCQRLFEPGKHNQIYCSPECSKTMTNAKIMQNYYEKRDRKKGKKRSCLGCGVTLSRYNPEKQCAVCKSKANKGRSSELLDEISAEWSSKE